MFSPTSSGAWKYWQAWRSRHGLCQYDGYIQEYVHNLPQTNFQLSCRDNSLPVLCPSLPHMGAQHYTKAPHIVPLTSKTSSNKLFNLISCMRRKNSLSLMTSSLSLLEMEDDSFTVIACSLWLFSCRSRKFFFCDPSLCNPCWNATHILCTAHVFSGFHFLK